MWTTGFGFAIIYANMRSVSTFGTLEYWLSAVKVFAICAFIVFGLAVVFGIGRPAAGFDHYTAHDGFLPHGFWGVWMGVLIAIFSFYGIEIIAVTAGEAADPATAVPRAMRTMLVRLVLFYVLSLGIMLAVVPWTETGAKEVAQSPFVKVFAFFDFKYAAAAMNFVLISAALSSMNANLYLCSRMLFSLARGGFAPAGLGRLSPSGTPVAAILISSVGVGIAVLTSVFSPVAYGYLFGVALGGGILVWLIILLSHLSFRKRREAAGGARAVVRAPVPLAAVPRHLPARRSPGHHGDGQRVLERRGHLGQRVGALPERRVCLQVRRPSTEGPLDRDLSTAGRPPPRGTDGTFDRLGDTSRETTMQIQKIVAAACALSALSGGALAQSSVTVYGRINLSLEHQSRMAPPSIRRSTTPHAWLHRSEDLGGGLKAGFKLEHGFNADTGLPAQPAFWARQSELNLSGGLGTVRLGNFTSEAYFATADYVSLHNHDTGRSADALYAYLGRNANKLSYRSPTFGRATVELAGALTEGQPANAHRTYNVAMSTMRWPAAVARATKRTARPTSWPSGPYPVGSFLLGGYAQRDRNGYAAGRRTISG